MDSPEGRPAGAPAVLLVISGVLGLAYSLLYFLWTLVPLAWGSFLGVFAAFDGETNTADALLLAFLALVPPALQCAAYAVCVLTSGFTLLGGLRYLQYRSRGVVWIGSMLSTATPLLCIVATSGSALNLGLIGAGLFGCLLGNVALLPLLAVGLLATLVSAVSLGNPQRAARFGDA